MKPALHIVRSEHAYALPSVLLLVVLLSLSSLSILTLQFLRRQLGAMEVSRVQADYAAESGVARALAELDGHPPRQIFGITRRLWIFEDGGEAQTEVRPWGAFLLVKSAGQFRKSRSLRVALLADRPGHDFDKALIFANSNHQLVLTGPSSVTGDLIVGNPGTSSAPLRGYESPRITPIKGTVIKERSPQLPPFSFHLLDAATREYESLLSGGAGLQVGAKSIQMIGGTNIRLDLGTLSDSTQYVFMDGPVTLQGHVVRREYPLTIVARRNVTIAGLAEIRGLVTILSPESIMVSSRSTIEHGILFSRTMVRLEPGASVVAQLIAPRIVLRPDAVARYPSLLYAITPLSDKKHKGGITLNNGTKVEGLILSMGGESGNRNEPVAVLDPQARIVGALYAHGTVTLDGMVAGSVMVNDFYFYEEPTHYHGWLRTGRIDRSSLPPGFLVPIGFSGHANPEVLDWL